MSIVKSETARRPTQSVDIKQEVSLGDQHLAALKAINLQFEEHQEAKRNAIDISPTAGSLIEQDAAAQKDTSAWEVRKGDADEEK